MAEKPIGLEDPPKPEEGAELEVDLNPEAGKKTEGEAAKAEPEVEIDESDPLYKKPDWKVDPVSNADDPNDKDYGPKVQTRINKLRASLSEAAKQRDKASKELNEAVNLSRLQLQKIQQLEQQLNSGSVMYTERQAEAEEAKGKVAEQLFKQALTTGDADSIAKANRELAEAQAKAAQLRQIADLRKQQIQFQQQQYQQVQPQTQYQQPPADDPKLTSWQRANPWFQTDPEMTDAAFEVHDELAASGVRVGSDTYYKKIDEQMRERFPDHFHDDKPPKKVSSPVTASTPAAPSQQANNANPGRVKLTANQVAIAQRLGITPQQYAKELIRLRNEGVAV